jgi:hypothetical protein
MTNEVTPVNIGTEQILAVLINKAGTVEITLEELMQDFSGKTIAVNQDENTQNLTFAIVDLPTEITETETQTAE